jgi:hypothetical protein
MSKPTLKVGKKQNTITINSIDRFNEMFTTNPDRIQQFIEVSEYPDKIDAGIIYEINKNAIKLSEQDFIYYTCKLTSEERVMMYLFENIIDKDIKIDKILKKIINGIKLNEKEMMLLTEWEGGNHGHYYTFKEIEHGELILE